MTAATTTLADWLLERLAEDVVNARSIQNAEYFNGIDSDVEPEVLLFADPARVLREVAAKRAIVEAASERSLDAMVDERQPVDGEDYFGGAQDFAQAALRALASVYAGAPGWREEWEL